jgi:predicted MFS family arabinose efflux permease
VSTSAESGGARAKPALEGMAYPAVAFVFLALLCLAYAINAADRQLFPTLLNPIRAEYGWDLKDTGLLATFFTAGLAAVGIPAGYIVDRASRKTVIIIAMVVYSVFTLATIYAYGFWDMLVYRALTGIGEGIQMAALFAAIGSFFYKKRSFFIGWMIVAYGAGAWAGPRIGIWLQPTATNWRPPFVWFAVIGVALALVVLFLVPKSFTESKGPQATGKVDEAAIAHMPTNLWNRNVWLAFVGCLILGFSLYGFMSLYAVYLREVLKFAGPDIGAAFSWFGMGGLLSFVGGWCGDKFPQRWVIAVAFACLAAVGFSMYNIATTVNAQSLLTFLTGFFGSAFVFVNLLSLLQRSVRPNMVGLASGIFLTAVFGAGSVAGYLMGWLVQNFGWGNAALIELTLFPVIGIVAMMLVDPKQLIQVAKKA